jgi:putative tricarboxylic transport membrane protein
LFDTVELQGAFTLLFTSWQPWLVVPPGLLIGLIFGAVPGLSTSIAMALFLPVTLFMDFLPAVLFLSSIFTGGGFGCAIPAVLINIPGTSAAVATTFDGYPMARKGLHNEALGLGLMASVVATFFGFVVLMLLVQPAADAVLLLGPSEMLVVALWGLTLIAVLRERHLARGLLAGVLGLLLGTVGFSSMGVERGTFGSPYLMDGVPAIPALIGLFAASQLFDLLDEGYIVEDAEKRKLSLRGILRGCRQTFHYPGVLFRGSLIGTLIGAVPGVGSSVANLVSYAETKRTSNNPETFGNGNPAGVVASEAANSSSEGGSMATLLALGIPGGGGTAILLGAFAMHNVTGGPRFIAEQMDVVYAIILSNMAQSILLLPIGIPFIFLASGIVRVPIRLLVPAVMILALLGSYTLTLNMTGPVAVLFFAVLGWGMRRYDYPVACTVVGVLLGAMVEGELLRTWQLSGGDPLWLLERPIALTFFVLLVASLAWPVIRRRLRARRSAA